MYRFGINCIYTIDLYYNANMPLDFNRLSYKFLLGYIFTRMHFFTHKENKKKKKPFYVSPYF